jgi:hypothetical protein
METAVVRFLMSSVRVITLKYRCQTSPVQTLPWLTFQDPTPTSMKMAVFWLVAAFSLVAVYRRFRGACISYQGDGGSRYL